jgi:hypothetical protein
MHFFVRHDVDEQATRLYRNLKFVFLGHCDK